MKPTKRPLSPELSLVMTCVRRAFGQELPDEPGRTIDWQQLLAETSRHSVAPLVQVGLGAAAVRAPDEARTALRGGYALAAFKSKVWFEPALRETWKALEPSGIPLIALKGSALAYLAYPHPTYRTLSDIDVLVPKDRVSQAAQVLLAHGFQQPSASLPDGHHHLPPLFTPNGQFPVELHHHVLSEENPYALDIKGIWQRAQVHELAGIQARVLAPEDTLIHICVHLAYGHRYEFFPLRTLVDILGLTTSTSFQIDWDLFVDRVRRTRTAGAVYWPLRLSRAWLGASVPNSALAAFAPPAPIRRLMDPVLESTYILNGEAPSEWGAGVLYDYVRERSLYSGCSASQQVRAAGRGVVRRALAFYRHVVRSATLTPFVGES